MDVDGPTRPTVGSDGLHRLVTGSTVGLAAGLVGLALPITLFVLASDRPGSTFLANVPLLQLTTVLALAGAILFAISLTLYRWGFWSLQRVDRRFGIASALCLAGVVGVLLLLLPMAIAFTASDAMASCIQGAPTKALTCLRSAAPLASSVGIAGVWLIWVGGLGVVVGIGLASVRYRRRSLAAGAALYALLLLGLLAPLLGLLFPVDGLVYPVLALPVLVLLAPSLISYGGHRSIEARGNAGSTAGT